jgi:hypothetical protein
MKRSDSASAIRARGRFRKNTARQLTCSISQPPLTGPIAVVIALKPDHVPIARPRSFSSKAALMSARLPGTRKAAPTPCAARPAISVAGDVATPHQVRVKRIRPEKDALTAELIAERSADQDRAPRNAHASITRCVGDRGVRSA